MSRIKIQKIEIHPDDLDGLFRASHEIKMYLDAGKIHMAQQAAWQINTWARNAKFGVIVPFVAWRKNAKD